MTVPFLDLEAHHRAHRDVFHQVLESVMTSSGFIGGRALEAFEDEWAAFCGTAAAVGVANGTDAIELVLEGLGIGPGDEVIIPANTFVATAEAVVRVGAAPVFCDVDPATLLVSAETVEAALGPRVAAVIVVHLFGQAADMTALGSLAERHGLHLIEDAAQAHGAVWDGRRVGSFGRAATFSFYPGKNLGALGDGGAVTTDDLALAGRIRELANHGRAAQSHFGHVVVGRNSRLDALQAGFLSIKLRGLDTANAARRSNHEIYRDRLPPTARQVEVDQRSVAVHHLEVIRSDRRDDLQRALSDAGIGTGIHYPVPCHLMAPYADYRRTPLPECESAATEILSLPMYPELAASDIDRVADAVDAAVGQLAPSS